MNQPGTRGARNDIWHSDISFSQTPPLGSVLHALQVPEGYGDTMFCNMVKAYAGLSPAMREMLRPLKALHSASGLAARNNARDNNASPITSVPDPAEPSTAQRRGGKGGVSTGRSRWSPFQ